MKKTDGQLLLLDKPYGWTSFQVVDFVRKRLRSAKVGHAGTLDPLATGLLLLCTGAKTKTIEQLQALEKEYKAIFMLGAVSPSYDLETQVVYRTTNSWQITASTIQACIQEHFSGLIWQKPPIYSAIKQQGKRLYELARRGKAADVQVRQVYIRQFDVEDWQPPHLFVRIVCSKGTYIRSLANDLGEKLGTGACLTALRRIRIGEYLVEDAQTPWRLVKQWQHENHIQS